MGFVSKYYCIHVYNNIQKYRKPNCTNIHIGIYFYTEMDIIDYIFIQAEEEDSRSQAEKELDDLLPDDVKDVPDPANDNLGFDLFLRRVIARVSLLALCLRDFLQKKLCLYLTQEKAVAEEKGKKPPADPTTKGLNKTSRRREFNRLKKLVREKIARLEQFRKEAEKKQKDLEKKKAKEEKEEAAKKAKEEKERLKKKQAEEIQKKIAEYHESEKEERARTSSARSSAGRASGGQATPFETPLTATPGELSQMHVDDVETPTGLPRGKSPDFQNLEDSVQQASSASGDRLESILIALNNKLRNINVRLESLEDNMRRKHEVH